MNGPKPAYDALIADGAIDPDPAQAEAVERLQALHEALLRPKRRGVFGLFAKPEPVTGLYLWGGVGRGKSMLMDLFFDTAPLQKKRRVHFHEFMANAHTRIGDWRAAAPAQKRRHPAYDRKAPDDPIPLTAADLANDAELLCFDEFQVSDIADAMLLGRLFENLFARGVVAVATSNRHPDDLYKDGLNRQLFLPAIDLIKNRMDVFELAAARDYRLQRLQGAPVYYSPLGPETEAAMDAAWKRVLGGAAARSETLTVKGRTLPVPAAGGDAARFTFDDLCATPLGASDYLAIVARYGTLFVDNIPIMGPDARDKAKRFVTLIDAVYESRTKFVCSAAAVPNDLYPDGDGSFEFERAVSRLIEMQSADYLSAERQVFAATDALSATAAAE
ncbi:MAG: cell division protein ZapE [Pseudomonadota bacterium]